MRRLRWAIIGGALINAGLWAWYKIDCVPGSWLANVMPGPEAGATVTSATEWAMRVGIGAAIIAVVVVIALSIVSYFRRGFATGLAEALLEQAKKYPLSSHTRLWLENRIRTLYRWHGTGSKTVAARMVAELAGPRKTAPKTPERQAEVRDLDEYRRRRRDGSERRRAA